MKELTADTWKDAVAKGKTILKVYMENCSWCTKYEPVFKEAEAKYPNLTFAQMLVGQEPSEFKRLHMKTAVGESLGAPLTFIFEDGENKSRASGFMELGVLCEFIETGRASKPTTLTINFKQLSTNDLKALAYDVEKEIGRR